MVHSYQRLQQKWRFQPLGGSLVYVCIPYTSEIHILYMYYTLYICYIFNFFQEGIQYCITSSGTSVPVHVPFQWALGEGIHPKRWLEGWNFLSPKANPLHTHIQRHCVKVLEFQQIDPWICMPMTKHVAGTSGTFWPIFSRKSPFGTKRHFPLRRHRYPKWRNVHPSCDHHPSRRRRLIRKSMVEARGRAYLRIDHQR